MGGSGHVCTLDGREMFIDPTGEGLSRPTPRATQSPCPATLTPTLPPPFLTPL